MRGGLLLDVQHIGKPTRWGRAVDLGAVTRDGDLLVHEVGVSMRLASALSQAAHARGLPCILAPGGPYEDRHRWAGEWAAAHPGVRWAYLALHTNSWTELRTRSQFFHDPESVGGLDLTRLIADRVRSIPGHPFSVVRHQPFDRSTDEGKDQAATIDGILYAPANLSAGLVEWCFLQHAEARTDEMITHVAHAAADAVVTWADSWRT